MIETHAKEPESANATVYFNLDQRRSSDKRLPVLYQKKENCCGCTACAAVCPVQAIRMEPDEEGFLYPAVCADLCIGCYQCEKVCAFQDGQRKRNNVVGGRASI